MIRGTSVSGTGIIILRPGEIDRMIEKVEAAIKKPAEYRTALITAAVTGKIDVRSKSARIGT